MPQEGAVDPPVDDPFPVVQCTNPAGRHERRRTRHRLTMDKHYLTPLFCPRSIVVFAGRADDPEQTTPQARALHEALKAQHFDGTIQFFDVRTTTGTAKVRPLKLLSDIGLSI